MTSLESLPHVRRYDVATVGLLLLAATVYFTYASLWSFAWQLKAYTRFVPITATIVESTVRSTGGNGTTHGEMFQPHIVFSYKLDGHDYTSDRYFYGSGGWRDRAAAESLVAQYPVGKAVTAYVDDDIRSMAVLDRRHPDIGVLLYLLPIIGLSLWALAYGLKRRRTA